MTVRALTGVLDDGSPLDDSRVPLDPRAPLRITQGSSVLLQLRILRNDGLPVRLDNTAVCTFAIKRNSAQSNPDLLVTGTRIPTEAPNRVDFAISSTALKFLPPGRLLYDVWLSFAGSRDAVIPPSPLYLEPGLQPP